MEAKQGRGDTAQVRAPAQVRGRLHSREPARVTSAVRLKTADAVTGLAPQQQSDGVGAEAPREQRAQRQPDTLSSGYLR